MSTQDIKAATNGAGAAAILAAAIGCFTLGVLALAGDAFKSISDLLVFVKPVGALSGVSTLAIIVWLASWFVLDRAWSGKTVAFRPISYIAYVLLAGGLLLTFPPFMDFVQGK